MIRRTVYRRHSTLLVYSTCVDTCTREDSSLKIHTHPLIHSNPCGTRTDQGRLRYYSGRESDSNDEAQYSTKCQEPDKDSWSILLTVHWYTRKYKVLQHKRQARLEWLTSEHLIIEPTRNDCTLPSDRWNSSKFIVDERMNRRRDEEKSSDSG